MTHGVQSAGMAGAFTGSGTIAKMAFCTKRCWMAARWALDLQHHHCRASKRISRTIQRLKRTTAGPMSAGISQALTCVHVDAPNPAEHSALSREGARKSGACNAAIYTWREWLFTAAHWLTTEACDKIAALRWQHLTGEAPGICQCPLFMTVCFKRLKVGSSWG